MKYLIIIALALPLLTACIHHRHYDHHDGPGNSENAPGHNKHDNGHGKKDKHD